jgi:ketosteroid isomerase-like protein
MIPVGALCLALSIAASGASVVRTFAVPGHAALELAVPESWESTVRPAGEAFPPTITLVPVGTGEIKLMIVPFWDPKGDPRFNEPSEVRRLVEAERPILAPNVIESELVLEELTGPAAKGYYIAATDKAPEERGWEYVVRSRVAVGDLLLSVTVLGHEKDSEAMREAFTMLRGARQAGAHPTVTLPAPLARVLSDYETAWRNEDAAALAALFAEDGFVLPSGSPPVRGRSRIEKHYAGHGGPLVLRALAFEVEGSVGFIIGGFAREAGQPDVGKFTLTLRKDANGRFWIVSDMDNGNSRP